MNELPLRVTQCRFEGEPKHLELRLEHVPGEHFECPHCRALSGVHDTIERRWRQQATGPLSCDFSPQPRTGTRRASRRSGVVLIRLSGSSSTRISRDLLRLAAQFAADANFIERGFRTVLFGNSSRIPITARTSFPDHASCLCSNEHFAKLAVIDTSARSLLLRLLC